MIRSSGTRCTCTVTSVMTPSRPSLPRIISRTLGPVAVLGNGRMTSTSPGTTTRKPRVMSAMSPYLSDCMPDDRVATQPPRVEWVKRVGEVAHGPAAGAQLLLEVGSEGAGLDAGQPGLGVDVQHLVQPTEVDREDGAGLLGRRLEAAGDVGAAAERDDHHVLGDGQVDDRPHLVLVGRVQHGIGDPGDDRRAAAEPGRAGSCRTCARSGRGSRCARAPRRAPRCSCARNASVSFGTGTGSDSSSGGTTGSTGDVQPDLVAHERGESGLVLVVEGDALDTPAPPLHVLHAGHESPPPKSSVRSVGGSVRGPSASRCCCSR